MSTHATSTHATQAAFIGIDIGTSSVKAVMAGADGARMATYSGTHPTARPAVAEAEQAPEDWMAHVHAALARFADHPCAGDVAAIGVTSQVNTHLFCDADLRPLHPALTWQDARAASHAAVFEGRITPEEKTNALGAPIPIDASHALSRMAWMADTHPTVWDATRHVVLPKDYAIACMTGVVSADPIAAIGLAGMDLRYAGALVSLMPRAAEVLPPLRDPLHIVGSVSAGLPFAGVPVVAGTMDAWASMFGLGVADEGEAMYLSGTSEVLGLISQHRGGAPGIITFPDWRGITLHAGPTQSGGASLAWLADVLGKDVDTLSALAAQAPITRDSPLFLPHLEGERAPLWDAASRGVFARMTSATGPAHLAAAVMEGVAFSARMALEAIEVSGGQAVQTLRHGGGGAVSDVWCQIRANALGRRLERVSAPESGAMGALVMAGAAHGALDDAGADQMRGLVAAARSLVVTDTVFEPVPEAVPLSDARFAAFQTLYQALRPLNAQLAEGA